jgi:2-keto-4-pentenoate hydratase
MTIGDAYEVQRQTLKKRLEEGQQVAGMKIGLTSAGMQALLGVHEPDFGYLTDTMLIREGDACRIDGLIAPKVEAELSFCLKKDLMGPGVTIADVYEATAYVVPSLEIVDSRIRDWDVKLFDTIADNGSAAGFVLGSGMRRIEDVDMRLTGMAFEKNGKLMNSGITAEVFGNPAAAVAWLANALAEHGESLKAGQIVMAGAVTAALPAAAGDCFTASFYGCGSVSVRFE